MEHPRPRDPLRRQRLHRRFAAGRPRALPADHLDRGRRQPRLLRRQQPGSAPRARAWSALDALVNNDVTVAPDVIEGFERAARECPRAGILAGKVYFADRPRTIWFAGQRVSQLLGYSGRPRGYGRPDGPRYSRVRATGRAVGALMADLARGDRDGRPARRGSVRLRRGCRLGLARAIAGLEVAFAPDARAWHRVSASTGGEAASTHTLYYGVRNTVAVLERRRPLGRVAGALRRTRSSPRSRCTRSLVRTGARRCAPCARASGRLFRAARPTARAASERQLKRAVHLRRCPARRARSVERVIAAVTPTTPVIPPAPNAATP